MTWEDICKRTDLIGGDIEVQEGDWVYRGPLASIELRGGMVFFSSPWMARMPNPNRGRAGPWERCPLNSSMYEIESARPQDIGGGRVAFSCFGQTVVLFPVYGSTLDPAKVIGLVLGPDGKPR